MSDSLPDPEELNRWLDADSVAERRRPYGEPYAHEPQGFKKLRIWQTGMDLVAECYRLSADFPPSEAFGLTRQLKRAAMSIVLNIAEGWGRNSTAELARFSNIAKGSLQEVDAALEVAIRVNFVQRSHLEVAFELLRIEGAMLFKFISVVKSRNSEQ